MVKVFSILLFLATVLIATEAVVAAPAADHPAAKGVTHHKSTSKTHKSSHTTIKIKKPQSTKPKSTKPKSTKPKNTKPKSTKPKSTKPKSTKPKSTKPKKSKSTKSTEHTHQHGVTHKGSIKGSTSSHTHNHGKTHSTKGKAISATDANILKQHNIARAAHHSPPLVWNSNLAAFAQKWASECQWQHSNNGKWGENLALQFPTWDSAIQAWYSEGQSYNYSNPGFSR
ncbi:CAP domain-containing protein [Endogone sp. FLAS-F59071]|nr:CAP domain-containing protein [Endogone sp. FLAS-F59071]|eukprot:RUS14572.1 CAP domain-containing protein [Endogone sp. FLAS-F59071]